MEPGLIFILVWLYAIIGAIFIFVCYDLGSNARFAAFVFWPIIVLFYVGFGIWLMVRNLYLGSLDLVQEAFNVLQEK